MLAGISDADALFASDEHYLLGKWIETAKAFGTSDDEKKLLEFNARTQVTMWGPPLFSQNRQHTAIAPGSPQDYAAKTQVAIEIFERRAWLTRMRSRAGGAGCSRSSTCRVSS